MFTPRQAGALALTTLGLLSLAPRALADAPRRRSLASCTQAEQRDKDEQSIALTVRSTCSMPIDCKVTWNLVCAPEARKRRKVTPNEASFTVQSSSSQETELSAAACGDDSWLIKNVTWRCEPSKE